MDDLSALEARLRQAAEALDPVPPHLEAAALAAYSLRTLDADLARLTFDSLVEGAGAVRGDADGPRMLTFTADDVSIEAELSGDRLVGQLLPAASPAEIEVRHTGGTAVVPADELGRFTVEPLGEGPFSLRCRLPSGRTLVTDWFAGR